MRRIGRCLVFVTKRYHHFRKFGRACTTVCPMARQRDLDTTDATVLNDEIDLCLSVSDELVDRYNRGNTVVVADIGDVTIEVSQSFLERFEVLLRQVLARNTAVEFQRSNRRYQNRGRGAKTRRAAFDIDKFLSAQVRTKACFGDNIVGQSKARCCRNNAVTAVRDVGERTTVNEGRSAF